MNLSYAFHVIADGKALSSILYKLENIQVKYSRKALRMKRIF